MLHQTPVCELVGLVPELVHEGHNLLVYSEVLDHQLYSLGGDHGVQDTKETELCGEET